MSVCGFTVPTITANYCSMCAAMCHSVDHGMFWLYCRICNKRGHKWAMHIARFANPIIESRWVDLPVKTKTFQIVFAKNLARLPHHNDTTNYCSNSHRDTVPNTVRLFPHWYTTTVRPWHRLQKPHPFLLLGVRRCPAATLTGPMLFENSCTRWALDCPCAKWTSR